MLAKEFILEKLQKLSANFPMVEMKYEYNHPAQTHIVELTPESAYYENRDLENAWIDIVQEFMERFPTEDLSFISSDSILRIEQPEYSFNTHLATGSYLLSQPDQWQEYWTAAAESFIAKLDFHNIKVNLPLGWHEYFPLEQPRVWGTLDSFDYHYPTYIGHHNLANLLATWQYWANTKNTFLDSTIPSNVQYAMAA